MFYRHLKVSVARRQRREPPARREPLSRLASGDTSRYALAAHRTEHDAAGKMHRVGESRTDDAASKKPGAKGTALRGFTGARSGAGESHPQRPSENTGVPGQGRGWDSVVLLVFRPRPARRSRRHARFVEMPSALHTHTWGRHKCAHSHSPASVITRACRVHGHAARIHAPA